MEQYNVAQYGVIGVMEFLNGEIYGCEAQIAALDGQIDLLDEQIDILDSSIDELDTKIDAVSESIEKLADNSINKLTTNIGNLKNELSSLGEEYDSKTSSSSNSSSSGSKLTYVAETSHYKAHYKDTHTGKLYADYAGKYEVSIKDIIKSDTDVPIRTKYGMSSFRTHFASGTMSAPGGLSEVNEQGHEIRILNKGDGILTAKITKNLARLGSDPVGVLADAGKQLLKSLTNISAYDAEVNKLYKDIYGVSSSSSQPITFINHIQGDVNPSTLKALVSAQKQITQNAVSEMMKKTLSLQTSSVVN